MELDRWFWKDLPHIGVKKVWDALCAYCFLPRLRDQAVFIEAIQEGLAAGDYFGYAMSVSEDGRYEGLRLDERAAAIYVDTASVLVKPDVARAQLEAERPRPTAPVGPPEPESTPDPTGMGKVSPSLPTRFFGTAEINPDRAGRDMGLIAEEVLAHLSTLPRAKLSITVEIVANIPDGVSEDIQRTILENGTALKFKSQGSRGGVSAFGPDQEGVNLKGRGFEDLVGTTADFRPPGPQHPLLLNHLSAHWRP